MKRSVDSSEDEQAKTKKTKANGKLALGVDASDTLFQASKQLSATDVYERGIIADGLLTFQIHMKWDHEPSRVRLKAQSIGHGNITRYDVFFVGPCVEYFNSIGLRFDIHDVLCLSLEGAILEKKSDSNSELRDLPMAIIFDSGVRLEFITKKQPLPSGVVVNSWQGDTFDLDARST
jgi:hypothetical protein